MVFGGYLDISDMADLIGESTVAMRTMVKAVSLVV
jgi:hypothetical protein